MACDGEDLECDVVISRADFVGSCLRCSEPTTGSYDSDDGKELKMKCVSCGFKQYLEVDDNNMNFLLTFSG